MAQPTRLGFFVANATQSIRHDRALGPLPPTICVHPVPIIVISFLTDAFVSEKKEITAQRAMDMVAPCKADKDGMWICERHTSAHVRLWV
jgi:hypothetical protein